MSLFIRYCCKKFFYPWGWDEKFGSGETNIQYENLKVFLDKKTFKDTPPPLTFTRDLHGAFSDRFSLKAFGPGPGFTFFLKNGARPCRHSHLSFQVRPSSGLNFFPKDRQGLIYFFRTKPGLTSRFLIFTDQNIQARLNHPV